MTKVSTAFLVLFYVAFAVFSVKVKKDVARAEAFDSFQASLPYGHRPPDFELPAIDGTEIALADEVDDGKLVLVNFWATWCAPCRLELPMLEGIYERYREDGLRILAVDVGEDAATVGGFLRDRPVSFPVLLDTDHAVAARYHIEAFPTTILLDDDGNILDVTEGLDPYLSYRVEVFLQADESEAF